MTDSRLYDCPTNYMSQANKALGSAGGGFSFFGGKTEKFENAADLYTQAANAFRMQKQSVLLYLERQRKALVPPRKLAMTDGCVSLSRQGGRSGFRSCRSNSVRQTQRTRRHGQHTSRGLQSLP